jgi:hypothetical protein
MRFWRHSATPGPSPSGNLGILRPIPHSGSHGLFDQAYRTEDIQFSPSGRVLAIVATSGSIILFAVDTACHPVQISRHAELHSPSLSSPHGVDFLAEDVIAVANRSGWVTFYRVLNVAMWEDRMMVEPIHDMDCAWFGRKGSTRLVDGRAVLCGPGAVRADGKQLIVACNNSSTVTMHPYRLQQGTVETGDGAIIAQTGLEIPDGVALSRDGRWLAVSEHHHRCIMIYRYADKTRTCVLRDAELHHPHGLCFDATGRTLYVADAGAPYVHAFVGGLEWNKSTDRSTFKLAAVEADAFRKTKEATPEEFRALEGGIKGMDVDPSGRVLATTCQHQILRFFETGPIAASSADTLAAQDSLALS